MILLSEEVDATYKGFPSDAAPMSLADIGKQSWNILKGDVPFPSAVILDSAMNNNAKIMQDFLRRTGVSFAPHGKTTMSPQLFKQQMKDGAWGITVATYQQFYIAWQSGIRNIILANQLIDPAAKRSVLSILKQDPDLNFYCLIDSVEGCEELQQTALQLQLTKPIKVLLELGFNAGRSGFRNIVSAFEAAKKIFKMPQVQLTGIECYEGIITTKDIEHDVLQIKNLLTNVIQIAKQCDENHFFSGDEILLTAGGSSYFDVVIEEFTKVSLSQPVRIVIRSGCYLTHDSKFYNSLFSQLVQRSLRNWRQENIFIPALEVWSVVQSRPEANLAILSFGKRDASYDLDLPIPQKWFSPQRHHYPELIKNWRILKLNDQHAYLQLSEHDTLAIGDLVACGVSHPCTTFDKWKLMYVVDDHYSIVNAIKTYF